MDKVQHFEIPADNIERASKFYKETFGWGIMPVPKMSYTLLNTAKTDDKRMILESEKKEGGVINGGMMKRLDFFQHPVLTITVKNMDKAIEMIKKNGGKIIKDKMEVEKIGWSAYFKDTEGNIMGIFQYTRM